ncbi:MAG: hypothetical protein RJA22_1476 [Verrucomicrobiota bacterium]|jgi:hypothetical protein
MKLHLFALPLGLLLAGPAPASADLVTDWNRAALEAIRADRTPPPRAARALAILHGAMHDAIQGIARTHEPYLVTSDVPAGASPTAAASAAAHAVLQSLFPAGTPQFDSLHAASLATHPPTPSLRQGIAWGAHVATRILAARALDGHDAPAPPLPPPMPGDWLPTPPAYSPYLLPQWAFLKCFSMTAASQFRPPGPPPLPSPAYAAAWHEVKAMGAATGSLRTPDQTEIARFWADGAGTETPPGHWNSIARSVVEGRGTTSLADSARLFALLNLAMADAAICAWDAKYHFHSWRPVTAIQNADLDGNDATTPDPAWTPLLPTPPFPDYVSGHSTFSGAAATILALFFGTDDLPFVIGSDGLPGVTRSFANFSAAAAEAMDSRLYGGIHFRFANEDGLQAGLGIGEHAFLHYLRPKGNRSRR